MTEFSLLGSGSGGNAILVEARRRLLLDCGFGPRELRRRLEAVGASPEEVDALVLTHEHSDHAGGAARLAEKLGVPVYGSRGTLEAAGLSVEGRALDPLKPQTIAGFGVSAFATLHDAREPMGLRVADGASVLGYLTDTGRTTPMMARALRACTSLIVEANHDADLLRNGAYPASLKKRIRGGRGHLDNDACADFLTSTLTDDTEHVVLHHLSRANNTPELALATVHARLARHGLEGPELHVGQQDEPVGPFKF